MSLSAIRTTPSSGCLLHQEREAAVYNAALSAKQRGDALVARMYMQHLSELHAQRPMELVERMEREQGLA